MQASPTYTLAHDAALSAPCDVLAVLQRQPLRSVHIVFPPSSVCWRLRCILVLLEDPWAQALLCGIAHDW